MSSRNEDNIKKQYEEKLEPIGYNVVCKEIVEKSRETYFFFLSSIYKAFKSERFQGTKLLDIGSGATVHNIVSASIFFPHIVLSDFVESNRKELAKWLKGGLDALDWSPMLNMVAEIEGYSDIDSGRKEIEARVRATVKSVVHCDLLADHVVPKEVETQYDVVMSALTVETAAPDYNSYVESLKRINHLLRPVGRIVLLGFTECRSWFVKENEFHYLSLTEAEIANALQKAGFVDLEWQLSNRLEHFLRDEYQKLYFVSARKR